jgi:hypothetical protein
MRPACPVGRILPSTTGPGDRVTLAHEMGHVCDLIQHHSFPENVIHDNSTTPPRFYYGGGQ